MYTQSDEMKMKRIIFKYMILEGIEGEKYFSTLGAISAVLEYLEAKKLIQNYDIEDPIEYITQLVSNPDFITSLEDDLEYKFDDIASVVTGLTYIIDSSKSPGFVGRIMHVLNDLCG